MPKKLEYKGHGEEVMESMVKANKGDKKAAEREYYATMNKHPELKAPKKK